MSAFDEQELEARVSARVPIAPGSRLNFSWGVGAELRLCEIRDPVTGLGGSEPMKATVVWCAGLHESGASVVIWCLLVLNPVERDL